MKDTFERTDDPNFVINKRTNMVINKNENELLAYKQQINQFLELKDIRSKYNDVKEQLDKITELLNKLI